MVSPLSTEYQYFDLADVFLGYLCLFLKFSKSLWKEVEERVRQTGTDYFPKTLSKFPQEWLPKSQLSLICLLSILRTKVRVCSRWSNYSKIDDGVDDEKYTLSIRKWIRFVNEVHSSLKKQKYLRPSRVIRSYSVHAPTSLDPTNCFNQNTLGFALNLMRDKPHQYF